MPIKPREQCIEIGGFQTGATGRIEDCRLGVDRLQFCADRGKGFLPTTWHIMIARRIIAHGVRQAALMLKIMIAPTA